MNLPGKMAWKPHRVKKTLDLFWKYADVISNAVSCIVIAKAQPEATEFTSSAKPIQKRHTTGLLHSVRNDEQGIEVLFSEDVYYICKTGNRPETGSVPFSNRPLREICSVLFQNAVFSINNYRGDATLLAVSRFALRASRLQTQDDKQGVASDFYTPVWN
jgi:hypothetical protein